MKSFLLGLYNILFIICFHVHPGIVNCVVYYNERVSDESSGTFKLLHEPVCDVLLQLWDFVPSVPGGQAIEWALGANHASRSTDSVKVHIPKTNFAMGCQADDISCDDDERPIHFVTVSEFYIDKFEVTNGQYAACVSAGACKPPIRPNSALRMDYFDNSSYFDYPILNVDWNQASTFCEWADSRLPTEAEWELAAQSSESTLFPWGDELPACTTANFLDGKRHCVGDTAQVGTFQPGASRYGVMDMAGNAREWVSDAYGAHFYATAPQIDPQGPKNGAEHVARGGYWGDRPSRLRVSDRMPLLPHVANSYTSFRCAYSPTMH